jgi:hypothetical protein
MNSAQPLKPPPSRAAQFRQLLARAATELGVKRSDESAQRLATCRLQRRMLRELMQLDVLSGKLSDPTKLLDADDRLRAEEERLAAPPAGAGPGSVKILLQPVVLCAKCGREAHVNVEPPQKLIEGVTRKESENDSKRVAKPKPRPLAIVESDRNKSRDIHSGPHAALKSNGSAHDPNVGCFMQEPSARDPHRVDNVLPQPISGKLK